MFTRLYFTGTYKDKKKKVAKWKKGSYDRRKTKQPGRMVLTKQATREEPVANI